MTSAAYRALVTRPAFTTTQPDSAAAYPTPAPPRELSDIRPPAVQKVFEEQSQVKLHEAQDEEAG